MSDWFLMSVQLLWCLSGNRWERWGRQNWWLIPLMGICESSGLGRLVWLGLRTHMFKGVLAILHKIDISLCFKHHFGPWAWPLCNHDMLLIKQCVMLVPLCTGWTGTFPQPANTDSTKLIRLESVKSDAFISLFRLRWQEMKPGLLFFCVFNSILSYLTGWFYDVESYFQPI